MLLPDGAADEPCDALAGRTPLQHARTPAMDDVARSGIVGVTRTAPHGFSPGSDVCTMSLLGYAPSTFYTGRAPIEAIAQNLPLQPSDTVIRCNLVTVRDGIMVDFSAGHIRTDEAAQLIDALNRGLGSPERSFHAGVSYRHLLIDRTGADLSFRATPPHDIQSQPISRYLPTGPGADIVNQLMLDSAAILAGHDVNAVRVDLGENPATQIWLWGQGPKPSLPSFHQRFGLTAACVTEVDLVRGLALLVGWDLLHVDGLTGFTDTNYAGIGAACVDALDRYDLVCAHIEAPDECGHMGNAVEKARALSRIDHHILQPVLEKIRTFPHWRVLIAPDHPTPCRVRTHTAEWPPFALAGTGIAPRRAGGFDEQHARDSGLQVDPASRLLPDLVLSRTGPTG